MRYFSTVLTVLLLLSCCQCSAAPLDPTSLAFYLVEESLLDRSSLRDIDLDSLALSEEPFIDLSGIESYDWETHTIALTQVQRDRFVEDFRIGEHHPFIAGGFVVLANGERIYLGYLSSPLSSFAAMGVPVIGLPFKMEHRTLTIGSHGLETDVRSDVRIRRILEEAGLLGGE